MAWPWKRRLAQPYGPDFTIESVSIDDPLANEDVYYTLPFNKYAQLIATNFTILLGILPATQYCFIEAMRGSSRLYVARTNGPGTVVGPIKVSGGVNLITFQDRNSAHWAVYALADYWFLYPFDTIHIGVTSPAARSCTISNVQLTFKIWEAL